MSNAVSGPSCTEREKKPAGFRARRSGGPTFDTSRSTASVTAGVRPAERARSAPPLPKRNKGRFFVGSIFLIAVSTGVYIFWSAFYMYQAFGIIQGRTITVSAPWNGIVVNWQIKEGDMVTQGQALAEISNLEMRHSLESLIDDLKLTQAQLDAETAKLKFQQQNLETESKQALAEFLQLSAELDTDRARYADLKKQLSRAKQLVATGNFSRQKYDEIHFESIGQQARIEKLEEAVEVLEARSNLTLRDHAADRQLQIQPLLTKIETTQAEIKRIREKIGQGRLLAPVSGRVTRRLCLTGESAILNEPIVEILEDDSTEGILYVPQKFGDRFVVGNIVEVELEPYQQNLRCEIIRLSDEFQSPPDQLKRYYTADEVLLPVYLKPLPEYRQFMSFRINGTIKMPVEWEQGLSDLMAQAHEHASELFSSQQQVNTEASEEPAIPENSIRLINDHPEKAQRVGHAT